MKKGKRIAVILLVIYLTLSIIGTVIINTSSNNALTRAVVCTRFGLLVSYVDLDQGVIGILSPFNNYVDFFLLVVDWSDGLRLYSDGIDAFGEWMAEYTDWIEDKK